ncbi:hypothetical protein HV327_14715 [Citrobacter freundii]|uniref:hypothetical protein n=1 Tax=Citrobacter freundii TaxID=546 RepID=UPI0015EA0390|nr:hypothetical protein [Citrobacter freundii]QLS06761.1 hypothetical protein HV327_14715 [Citrobacter freundii]
MMEIDEKMIVMGIVDNTENLEVYFSENIFLAKSYIHSHGLLAFFQIINKLRENEFGKIVIYISDNLYDDEDFYDLLNDYVYI